MAVAFGAALAGCASNIKQMEEAQASGGTAFTQALTEEYRSFVAHEKDERDWAAADTFAIKGLAAATGQVVLPDEVPEAGEHTQALTDARKWMMTVFDEARARDATPQAAARAQRAFDCWQHEAQEDHWYDAINDAHVASCHQEFEAAMQELPAVISGPDPGNIIILFAFDKSDIDKAGQAVIEVVLAEAARMGSVNMSVTGHADRAGSEPYNMALSLRRADAVRRAFIAGGIPADAITVAGRGESEPAVPTPDGVKEQANRRVEIVLQ
jgi:OOP family OmpA-OmpF porin